MSKRALLNVGCGSKFHVDWTNVDMKSTSPHVQAHNLLQGFPFPSDHFDVVYHSQVLEHFPKENVPAFMAECYRVLRPGGVLRVVVPDLENNAKEYLRHLTACVEDPNAVNLANYDWIMLELYDQTVRNYSGGEMAKFLSQPGLLNEDYVFTRSGRVARNIVERARQQQAPVHAPSKKSRSLAGGMIRKTRRKLARLREKAACEATELGRFRLGGEIHMWMYDRFSLSRLLQNTGSQNIRAVGPHESSIPGWPDYELDVRDGNVCDPSSLFMEAVKPH